MTEEIQDAKDVKGLQPKSIRYAKKIDDDFAAGLAGFYSAVWADRENGISKKQKHLLVFAIACSNQKTKSAVKILQKLKKFDATAEEIKDAMMIAAWTGGIQNFTDFTPVILEEMEKLGF
ncbi:carboxymuconolactone decarboxylase family protein [Methanolobus sp. ZRKC3]|uniref:carboxymuconolactone decarboxylase family protein n=1 Tax=Methanolobus sp. ZRKC3 TaxID=3125786 RepID=UPI00324BFB03